MFKKFLDTGTELSFLAVYTLFSVFAFFFVSFCPKSLELEYQPQGCFHLQKLPLLRYRSNSPQLRGICFVIPAKAGIYGKGKFHSKMPKKQGAKATLFKIFYTLFKLFNFFTSLSPNTKHFFIFLFIHK